jgi:DNA-binding NarL/FixJ family response regulator
MNESISEIRRLLQEIVEHLSSGSKADARKAVTKLERIAALAASGLTNRQIAERCFVSPKTVEANLARVYRKLGIRTRAELGRVMAREGPAIET